MTTNAGALAVVVEADTASFESSMTKVGAAAEREMKRVEKANVAAKVEGDRFVTMLQRQVDSFGLTGTALLAYEARLKGVSAQAQPLIDKLNDLKRAQQQLAQQANSNGLANVGHGMRDAANAADSAAHGTSGITRELIVLAHEASQGNLKRFGGSLLVLAEYSTKAQAALSLLFGPIGVVIAAVGLLGLAAYQGSKQADELRRSLILTGDYAGITAGQFTVLAKSISEATSSGIGKASAALQALVMTGEVGPRMLADMASATVKLEALTGKSAEEIAKDFTKMQEAPTKWAEEANRAYNFLSVAQYDHIKRLEQEGQKEEAAIEVLVRLNDHLGTKIPESLSWLGQALHTTGLKWDEFWHYAMHGGAPETTQDKIAAITKQIQDAQDMQARSSGPARMHLAQGSDEPIIAMQKELAALQAKAKAENDAALATAGRLKAQKEGIAASDYFTKLDEERKGVDRLNKDLTELQANIAKRVAAGGPASLPSDASDEAFIRHRDRSFTDKSAEKESKALETAVRTRLELYAEEQARISDEAAQYVMYGKVLDKTAEAIARVETQTGKFAKASDSAKASIIAQAQAVDRAEAFKKESEAQAAAAKQREKADEALTKHLADLGIATDAEIEKLQEDTKYLSLNTLERKIAAEALKIEKERRTELADKKNEGHDDVINASALKRTQEITAALIEADTAQKSFGFGAERAFAQYQQGAANAAKFSETFVNGSLQHMEDAIVQFAETGKLSFKSLFVFMADEFIRNQVRMQIAKLTTSAGGSTGLIGTLAGLFGGSSGGGSGLGNAGAGDYSNAGLAAAFSGASNAGGLGYVPYDGYPAKLHEGERVMTRIENQRSKGEGGGSNFDFSGAHYSFGAGVDASTMAQYVRTAQAQTKSEVQRALSTNGRFAA
jgi:lambda family phage tail tape measure protein